MVEIKVCSPGSRSEYAILASGSVTPIDSEVQETTTQMADGTTLIRGLTGNGYCDIWNIDGEVLGVMPLTPNQYSWYSNGTEVENPEDLITVELNCQQEPDEEPEPNTSNIPPQAIIGVILGILALIFS